MCKFFFYIPLSIYAIPRYENIQYINSLTKFSFIEGAQDNLTFQLDVQHNQGGGG